MEEGLPFAALEVVGGFALAVQVAEPLAVLRVGEMFETIFVKSVEPLQEGLVLGDHVGEQRGGGGLVVDPPEFHVRLEFQMRLAEGVHEVEDAVVLLVPAELQRTFDDGEDLLVVFGASGLPQIVEQEAHRLQRMAGVEHAALAGLQVERAVLADILEHQPQFGVPELLKHEVHRSIRIRLILVIAEAILHHEGEIGDHHEHPEGLVGGLGGHRLVPASSGVARVHAPEVVAHRRIRLVRIGLLLGCAVEFRRAHRGEAVREDIVRRDDGSALLVQREVVRAILGFAMLRQEIVALFGDIQKLRLRVARGIQRREHIDDAPLHPHVFRGVIDTAVAVEAGEVNAVLLVDGVVFPEGDNVLGQRIIVALANFGKIQHFIMRNKEWGMRDEKCPGGAGAQTP